MRLVPLRAVRVLLALAPSLFVTGEVLAACNLIPGTEKTFNSSLGATDQVVTVVFTPPSGPRHAVVLTAAADCAAVTPDLPACAAELTGGGTATCVAGG